MTNDLNKCPGCGGPADNGHDRCLPPSPYYCTKCTDDDPAENKIAAGLRDATAGRGKKPETLIEDQEGK